MSKQTEQPFFRAEAIDHNRQRLHGDILLLPRLSHSIILLILVVWVIAVAIWAVGSTFARKETVTGWLEPPNGVIRVYPQQAGSVSRLHVEEGDAVVTGQPLIEISQQKLLTEGVDLQSKLIDEYEQQSAIILRQIARNQSIFTQQLEDNQRKIDAAKQELGLVEKQVEILQKRHELVKAQGAKAAVLRESGHISAGLYEQTIAEELSLSEETQELQRIKVTQQNLIDELLSERQLLPSQAANQQDQLNDRLSVLTQQKSELQQRQSYTIVAAKSGIINNLQVFEGGDIQVDGRTPIMSILPEQAALNVQLLVPVRAAGFVEPGQDLFIRYDAFPFQKFGLYEGTITSVSRTLLLPNELINSPISINEPVYRVSATLNHTSVSAYGKAFALRPGMTLSADIQLDQRTVIEWLFEPLLSIRGNL